MNIFHHSLKGVEVARLWNLYFPAESHDEILVHDSVGRRKECEYSRHQMAFIVREAIVPIREILRKIYFSCRPKRGLSLGVKVPKLQWVIRRQTET